MGTILLRGGAVFDGSGAEAVESCDVLLNGDTVAAVGPGIDPPADAEIVDCRGQAVAPGFIDIHTHSDQDSLLFPLAESRVLSGVTTEVMGNCGTSGFPFDAAMQTKAKRLLGDKPLDVDWTDGESYYARAAAIGCSVNRATLVGHGNLRAMTVGYGDEKATPAQLDRMAAILEQAMHAGAYGLSSGLVYPPGCYASTEELYHLSRVVGRMGGLYTSHIRSESRRLLDAIDEFIRIVREGGCRGVISHLKTLGPANWGKIDDLLDRVGRARCDGLDIYADRYPYLASWTGLDSNLFLDWVHDGGIDAELGRLKDPALRPRLREELTTIVHPEADWADRLMVVSCPSERNAFAVGLTVAELGRRWEMDPFEAAIRLLIEEETRVSAVFFCMSEANLVRILKLPYVAVASDASMRNLTDREASQTHPRAFGTPARFLERYVRELGVMPWGEGVRRLTGLPAEIMGWKRRGRLEAGSLADVVVFQPDRIADRATYARPAAPPAGITHVLVAGEFVARDGVHTGAKPGRLILKGRAE